MNINLINLADSLENLSNELFFLLSKAGYQVYQNNLMPTAAGINIIICKNTSANKLQNYLQTNRLCPQNSIVIYVNDNNFAIELVQSGVLAAVKTPINWFRIQKIIKKAALPNKRAAVE